ncbi:MAG: hypothetical protein EOM55_02560 [Clostridia bacterium]|nr:hypothetical protein [Clostridia bacterium]
MGDHVGSSPTIRTKKNSRKAVFLLRKNKKKLTFFIKIKNKYNAFLKIEGEVEGKLVEMDYACFFLLKRKKSLASSFLLYPTQVALCGNPMQSKVYLCEQCINFVATPELASGVIALHKFILKTVCSYCIFEKIKLLLAERVPPFALSKHKLSPQELSLSTMKFILRDK